MPVVSKDQAIELLTREVEENLRADELLEVYDELFPDDPYPAEEARRDVAPLIERIVGHIQGGLAVEEIVDRWGLVFPKHRNVWYDEGEGGIHYSEESEPLHAE
jgi:hypothetical protein